jgi:cardiolipin synthase (CMP-forming)
LGPGGAGRTVEPTQAESQHVEPQRVRGVGKVLTVPNLISFARLLGVPLFLYLFLGSEAYGWAVAVLALGGLSDWVDGFIARRLRQVSRLGELLDPFADRLYILATIVAFTAAGVLPWAFTVALLARDILLGACLLVLRHHGYGPPSVHYVGKTATFILLLAFPMLLLARVSGVAGPVVGPSGWALLWWGIVLYWVAAVFYVVQVTSLVRAVRRTGAAS